MHLVKSSQGAGLNFSYFSVSLKLNEMKKHLLTTVFLSAMLTSSFSQPTIGLQSYVPGFSSPVDIANCGDDRLFIVEQSGYIRIINAQGTVNATAFLDIDARVQCCGERGLLGLAFHPDYLNNGYFFLYYTDGSGNLVISRFSVSAGNADVADASSEVNVITIPHPGYSNHNGGNLEFGPDGYLYIGTGDGGGGGDPDDNGQNPQAFLGKMLRLDVDALPYQIPPSNPFVGTAPRDEIWAFGLRNPWRFSFDKLTGDLWIGDVGQNAREEVNFQAASSSGGQNYGWKCYEGNITYGSSGFGCNSNYAFPVYDYNNPGTGCTSVGGIVYRGCRYPNLYGYYVFCDYCSGRFWTIYNSGGGIFQTTSQLQGSPGRYVAFGEDRYGELFAAGLNGTIYRVTETTNVITASGSSSICPGNSVTLSAPSGYDSYNWLLDGTTSVGSGLQVSATQAGSYTLTVNGFTGCTYTSPGVTVSLLTPPSPVVNAAANSLCQGSSLQLTTGNFSGYSWTGGSTGASLIVNQAGSYSVSVTDGNGCTGSSSAFSVTENPLPQPVIQQTSFLCAGSTADLTTDAFVSYSWSTGEIAQQITVSQAGDYDVTVTDVNGCVGASQSFTVIDNQLPQPLIISSNGSAFCEGETTVLTTDTGYISYFWSTGQASVIVSVSMSGGYRVTVTDANGCVGISDTFEIVTLPLPAPVILPGNEVTACAGDTVVLSTSVAYSAYSWSSGETTSTISVSSSSSSFYVTVEDVNGCEGFSDSVIVDFFPIPAKPEVILNGMFTTSLGYKYQWYVFYNLCELATNFSDFIQLTGDTLYYLNPNYQACYILEITDEHECSSFSDPIPYYTTPGISEPWLNNLTIQPNPFTSEIVVQYTLNDLADLRIRILDLTGKEIATVLNEKQGAGTHIVSIHAGKMGLSSGIYFLEMGNGILKRTFKVVKM